MVGASTNLQNIPGVSGSSGLFPKMTTRMNMGLAAALSPKTDILDVLVFVKYTCGQTVT
ncbi:hypothetical protein E4U43_001486 [Claviceps pusilla]|uniref:Uncharacterized protein n=1 Tax=Claviceps pusilla TaxID=123648 RepID=A0A9P7T3I8_9HYPO|nr:hypothetical protein E4U43_001486 [Claviceps pusilla]